MQYFCAKHHAFSTECFDDGIHCIQAWCSAKLQFKSQTKVQQSIKLQCNACCHWNFLSKSDWNFCVKTLDAFQQWILTMMLLHWILMLLCLSACAWNQIPTECCAFARPESLLKSAAKKRAAFFHENAARVLTADFCSSVCRIKFQCSVRLRFPWRHQHVLLC